LASLPLVIILLIFLFHDTPPTHTYTLSLHDALPISRRGHPHAGRRQGSPPFARRRRGTSSRQGLHHARRPRQTAFAAGTRRPRRDRKSTRLNSSHVAISYAVFCLKKKSSMHIANDRS